MRQRINVGEHVFLIIHQDIRRRVVAAGGEGATAFSLRLVAIAPTAVQATGQRMGVIMAEWRKRCDDLVDCFLERDVGFDFLNERDVGVVGMKLVEAEDPPP